MALPALITDFYRHGFVRQPLWQMIQVGNWAVADPVRAVFTVTFNSVAGIGNTIAITWNGNTVTMTADPSPDDSGTQFDIGANATEQADLFAQACSTNFYYSRDFNIQVVANVVTFTAWAVGDEYQFSEALVTPVSLAGVAQLETGDDGVVQANYSMAVRIMVEPVWKSNEWTLLPEIYAIPAIREQDAQVRFNIAPLLHPYCAPFFPAFGLVMSAVRSEGIQRRYLFDYYEIYGDPPTPKAVQRLGSSTSPRRCWFGGLMRRDRGHAIAFAEQCTEPNGAHYFHTWRGRDGNKRRATKSEPVYLNWYNHSTTAVPEDPDS